MENETEILWDVYYNHEVDAFWKVPHSEHPLEYPQVERIEENLKEKDAINLIFKFEKEF